MVKKQDLIKLQSNNKKVIWALFDDDKCSYKLAIKKYYNNKFEIHSVGINDLKFKEKKNYFYHKIDLSLINFNLLNELKKLPKPDIILASPPCESWSGADCSGKMFKSIDENQNWKIANKKFYDIYNEKCNPVKRRNFNQKEKSRILGESTIGATIQIIQHFKPIIWIIENPLTSKTWQFQEYHWDFQGIMNKTFYSSYDNNFSSKPTIFKSNIELKLNRSRVKGNSNHMSRGSYSQRSMIPLDLIKDILDKIFLKVNNVK